MDANKQAPTEESDELETPESGSQPDSGASPAAGQPEASPASGSAPSQPANAQSGAPSKKGGIKRLLFGNIYLFIFVILIAIAGGGVFITLQMSKKSNKDTPKTTASLTDKELAALRGSTTLVGDSQQILDIQSSSVFEGQVLMKNNLEIAGTLKVGSPLSLSSLNVGGKSTLGETTVGNTLAVAGKTTLAGEVAIQKTLSVSGTASFSGTLTANTLAVSNFQITGDILIPKHIVSSGGIPGKTDGGALGSGGTTSINGSDTAGTININTGSSPVAGTFINVTFTQKFNTTPHIVITPVGPAAAGLNYYITRTSAGFTVATTNAAPGSSSFSFDYIVIN